jgi:glycosyltransferase involved in cell wall biosynthesis
VRRLLLVSQRPQEYGGGGSTRWRFFRSELPRHGWEVDVVTARPNPTADEFATDAAGRRLYAARAAVMGRAGAIARPLARRAGIQPEALAPSALWALGGRRALRRAIAAHRPDVVLATSPPVASHLLTAGLARDLEVPLVCELRDNWAGNPYYDAGGTLLSRIEGWALAPAAAVVVVTPAMADVVRRLHPPLGDRVHVLPNGFDPRVLERRRTRAPASGPLTLVHAGAVYGERSPARLLEAMRLPGLDGRFRLELVGGGSLDVPEGPDVVPRGSVPWEEALDVQAAADIGVVLYSDDPTAQPGKLYELLALGKPILALVDPGNATDTLLRSLGQGAGCARHDDVAAIAAALERLATDPPAPVAAEALQPWNRAAVTERLAALLEELAR